MGPWLVARVLYAFPNVFGTVVGKNDLEDIDN